MARSGASGHCRQLGLNELRRQRRNDVAVSPLARVPDRFRLVWRKSCRLLNSLGCLTTVFRDTFLATGRAQAANNAGLRFGTGLILGFAVGGL